MSTEPFKCHWCGKLYKTSRAMSEWQQQVIYGKREGQWFYLCNRCANRRLNNPYNALLQMRHRPKEPQQ